MVRALAVASLPTAMLATALVAASVVATSVTVLASTRPAEASVEGRPFTETECQAYSDSVARLYTAGLDREPEAEGFNYWMTEYTGGRQSLASMAAFFVTSAEFVSNYGNLSDEAFVRQLYRNVLGREGEADGVEFWSGQLVGGQSRATVLLRFAESPENVASSGTNVPGLGYYNEGLGGAWDCQGWPAVPLDATCAVVGRDGQGQPVVRINTVNRSDQTRTATIALVGRVGTSRVVDQYATVAFIRPGQTVQHELSIGAASFSAPEAQLSCEVVSLAWRVDEPRTAGASCTMTGSDGAGRPMFVLSATNPRPAKSNLQVELLLSVDGLRVSSQTTTVAGVEAMKSVDAIGVLASPRLRGIQPERIGCEAVNPVWG